MKKYFSVAGILGAIALVCAALIALMNFVTSSTIKDNETKAFNDNCSIIFDGCEYESTTYTADAEGYIEAKTAAKKNGEVIGYIYTVSGSNSYGAIKLMVGITKDLTVKDVEFLSNTESFASTVNSHVKSEYPSTPSNTVEWPSYDVEDIPAKGELSEADVNGIDTTCGATYGAKLVKALVTSALNEAKGA